ncbi:MAG: HAD-IIA family hydrolase [Tannerella sp.]|jgi:NagD protein|nr:HAD-IIA family hydrolase [Tannerella sp.]
MKLKNIKHLALDMDGTIYTGTTLFPFTLQFLADMKSAGIGYTFLTNNPSKSKADYLTHLKNMGIEADASQLYASGEATIDYIKRHYPDIKRLFILGTPSLIAEFEASGFISTKDDPNDRPDAVIASFDKTLTYSRLCRAAWWVSRQLLYIATNPDYVCPTDQPTVLVDCGSLCACIEQATSRKPDIIIGKPAPRMLENIIHRYRLHPQEIAMVGDRLYTDVATAKNTGAVGVLVLSGETTLEDLKHSNIEPDIVVENIKELGQQILNAKCY